MNSIPIGAGDRELPPLEAYSDEPAVKVSATHEPDSVPKLEKLEPIDWTAFEGRDPPARTWWIQDWLNPSPTLLAGGGGIGKSTVAQTVGTALATTRPYIAAVAAPLRVLCWFCEDDADEIWRRQVAICRHLGVRLSDLVDALAIFPRIGSDNTLFATAYGEPVFTREFEQLRQQVNDYRADVLILDNIAQVYGCNLNDPHQVTQFVNGCCGLVRGRPFAPILLGHVAKSQGSEFSGTAAWENACRMRWYLGARLPDQQAEADGPSDPNAIYLAKRKANYTAKDYRKLVYTAGLFIPEEAAGPRFNAGFAAERAEEVLLAGMLKLREAGIHTTDGKTSSDYLPRQLVDKGHAGGFSKRELTAAMNRLMGAGKLKRCVIGKYGSNRHDRFGLVVAE